MREAPGVALPDEDPDELLRVRDDRVVVVGHHRAPHLERRAAELAAGPRRGLERLGALAAVAPGAAADHDARRRVGRVELTEVERALDVEGPHRVLQERGGLDRVVPALAVAVAAVDVERVGLHAFTAISVAGEPSGFAYCS